MELQHDHWLGPHRRGMKAVEQCHGVVAVSCRSLLARRLAWRCLNQYSTQMVHYVVKCTLLQHESANGVVIREL